jgi:hypothetical protein
MKPLTRLLAFNNITIIDMVKFLQEENFITEDNFWFLKEEELIYQLYVEEPDRQPFLLITLNVLDTKSKILLDADMLGWALAVKKGQQKESINSISYIISQLLFTDRLNAEKFLQIAYITEAQQINSPSMFGGGKLRRFLDANVEENIQDQRVKYLNQMLRVEYFHVQKAILLRDKGYSLQDVAPLLEYPVEIIQDMLGDSYEKQPIPIFTKNLKWPFVQTPTGYHKLFLSEL